MHSGARFGNEQSNLGVVSQIREVGEGVISQIWEFSFMVSQIWEFSTRGQSNLGFFTRGQSNLGIFHSWSVKFGNFHPWSVKFGHFGKMDPSNEGLDPEIKKKKTMPLPTAGGGGSIELIASKFLKLSFKQCFF